MQEYVPVNLDHLKLIKKWLEEREPTNAILAIDEIIQKSPKVNLDVAELILLDNNIKFLVG